jgi:hypothetical protein
LKKADEKAADEKAAKKTAKKLKLDTIKNATETIL